MIRILSWLQNIISLMPRSLAECLLPVTLTSCLKMLCPEVWNFEPPKFSVSTKLCESEEEIFRTINHQYFNHHVSITLPNTIKTPDLINSFLEDSQFYRINNVPANELVNKQFLDFFAKGGELTATSLNEFSYEDSVVITPCGKLILSLSKNTFQELGVEGTITKHSKSSFRKYFVVLDLTSDSNEMKKKCEQLEKKLVTNKNIHFDLVLAWEPRCSDVCPSSIAYYFSKKGYFVKTCDILYKKKLNYNVEVPLYDAESDASELIEWLGAYTLECDMSNDNCFSTMKCPEKNEVFGQVMQLSFTGLISHNRLKQIITGLKNYVEEKASFMWISLTVQGFQDTILKVKNKNFFLGDGDHHCTLIFRCNQPTLVYTFQDKKS